jgi:hypothetical protein
VVCRRRGCVGRGVGRVLRVRVREGRVIMGVRASAVGRHGLRRQSLSLCRRDATARGRHGAGGLLVGRVRALGLHGVLGLQRRHAVQVVLIGRLVVRRLGHGGQRARSLVPSTRTWALSDLGALDGWCTRSTTAMGSVGVKSAVARGAAFEGRVGGVGEFPMLARCGGGGGATLLQSQCRATPSRGAPCLG